MNIKKKSDRAIGLNCSYTNPNNFIEKDNDFNSFRSNDSEIASEFSF